MQSMFNPQTAKKAERSRDTEKKRQTLLSSAKTTKRPAVNARNSSSPQNSLGGTVSAMLLQNLKLAFQRQQRMRQQEHFYQDKLNKIQDLVSSNETPARASRLNRIKRLHEAQQVVTENLEDSRKTLD